MRHSMNRCTRSLVWLTLPLFSLQPKHQDTFSLAPQRPLTTINPIGHSLHPNGAPTLKPSPVHRTIQPMPWEQRSLYNQWDHVLLIRPTSWGTNCSSSSHVHRRHTPTSASSFSSSSSSSPVVDPASKMEESTPAAPPPCYWNVALGTGKGPVKN